jgi:nucleotidyltransferase/DNA polymerase involved in DNA repair
MHRTDYVLPCLQAYVQLVGDEQCGRAIEIARHVRSEVYRLTKCPLSVGIGMNMLLAKLGSVRAKPSASSQGQQRPPEAQGVLVVDDPLDFMKAVKLRELPGIGWRCIGGEWCA